LGLKFYKYHGTGNDFVIIDQFKSSETDLNSSQIKAICNRRFGIGADGLIIIRSHKEADFEMIYFNSDGQASSMCGNGGRCIVMFAYQHQYIKDSCSFIAVDGMHQATIHDNLISLEMSHISQLEQRGEAFILNTGSPHYVYLTKDSLERSNFTETAQAIRYSEPFAEEGININAFQIVSPSLIKGITYERGVEDITLSCGTGVTAMAIVHSFIQKMNGNLEITVKNLGGELSVQFTKDANAISNVWLKGPAVCVFEGEITLSDG